MPHNFQQGRDAALFYPPNGKIYLFKSDEYVRITPPKHGRDWEEARDELKASQNANSPKKGYNVDANYPKKLPGGWKIDNTFHAGLGASFMYPEAGKNYFFPGNKYIRLRTYQMDKSPTNLPGGWNGLN